MTFLQLIFKAKLGTFDHWGGGRKTCQERLETFRHTEKQIWLFVFYYDSLLLYS